jgi:hypothetical protein
VKMNRRGFFLGLTLIAAPGIVRASSLMAVKPWLETLYGDGVHSDLAALRALLRGEVVRRPSGMRVGAVDRVLHMPPKKFFASGADAQPVHRISCSPGFSICHEGKQTIITRLSTGEPAEIFTWSV